MTTYVPHYVSLEFSEEAKKDAFAPAPAQKPSHAEGGVPAGMASFATGLTAFIRETGGEGVDIVEDNRDAYAELEEKFEVEGGGGNGGAKDTQIATMSGPNGVSDGKKEHPAQAKA